MLMGCTLLYANRKKGCIPSVKSSFLTSLYKQSKCLP